MTLDDLIENLEGVKYHTSGDYYTALCPAHEDNKSSLQVSEHDDGSLGVFCHAGCPYQSIMHAMGHTVADLFPEDKEKVYTYRSAEGNPVYDVVRMPGKDFRQRRYIDTGHTEWNMEGVQRILYNLPEILASEPGQAIFIVEGEKDADSLMALGWLATTSGAAGTWNDEFAQVLSGKNCVIVQDKDDAGRKHASQVMMSIRAAGGNVRLVEARQGKDVSDHLAHGYNVDDLVEPSLFRPFDFTRNPEPVDWIWEDYVAVGDLVLLSGKPGLGKSWLTMGLSVAMCNGDREFLQKTIANGKVLYFDEENPRDVIYSRMVQKLGLNHFNNLRYISAEGLRLDTHPELLVQEVMLYQPKLIVIDSLARVHAKEENSVAEMSEILNSVLKPLARKNGAAVVLIHHSDKGGHGPRGSGDIEAAVDASIGLDGMGGAGMFSVRIRKSRRMKSPEGSYVEIKDVPGAGVRLEAR